MSANTITIKPSNHSIYQCPIEKKIGLIDKIVEENKKLDIVVVCSSDVDALRESLANKDIRVVEDRELVKDKEFKCEFIIGYDMPIKAIVYMARVSKATKKAVMLLEESEQKGVHSIEMLLGRAVKQESIEGFMYPVVEKKEEDPNRRKPLTKEQISEIAKKRHEDATREKPKFEKSDKPKFDKKRDDFKKGDFKNGDKKDFSKEKRKSGSDDKWAKKKKAPNKFLGKDENGKAIFSGKSGERNHRYDGTPRDQYDAPRKVGKKISIKARKPKED